MQHFNVIVVGAGHAGCEAALAAARLGMKTAIFTITLDNIGIMSCNPSIGGPAKSHLVKELDALGGEMGRNIDKTLIQIRVLNTRKGPAVRSLRAQADKREYSKEMKKTLENCENLSLIQGMVVELIEKDKKIMGIKIREGMEYTADCVILATGTFLRGKIHIGDKNFSGGRMGELSSDDLPVSMEKIGLNLGRFKTGTPPRIDQDTIDYSKLEEQPGVTDEVLKFSSRTDDIEIKSKKQISCYIAHTNNKVHQVIRDNRARSPLFNGSIHGTGPRYCPSIEDKVFRYADKESHHIFLEKEGMETKEIYLSGFSSSLPTDVQEDMLHNMDGMENAAFMRYAYAIEYDYVQPQDMKYSLESKNIDNLFLAGQINGTSGYEEAAAQGLLAGINATLKIKDKPPLVLDRADSYIGTLIDDLVTKGTNEPYRMFTSRSEYRLILREDNADLRLTKIGYDIGLVSEIEYKRVINKEQSVRKIIEKLQSTYVGSGNKRVNEVLAKYNETLLKEGSTLFELLRRPDVTYNDIKYIGELVENFDPGNHTRDIEYQVEVQVKYSGYIDRALKTIERHKGLENKKIPNNIDYNKINNIPKEAKDKLNKVKPMTVGQASRISGITPADIQVILVHLKMGEN
ncbi:MAG: tRNA uridine-5-carboxymethylaminomethyl(34) synthesis enzyme MnmG [Fusobacteriaceae bacterium]|jgi:tRNA uridine 5-carboxymethylaminomethyl modification enzyme|nr:tRNA uridine-5-carboxymethylaminomethyl(34) synthesis enzyme MnmG [Fusobacteriaceae bacterium]